MLVVQQNKTGFL